MVPAEPPLEPRAAPTPGPVAPPIDVHADDDRPSRAARIGGSVGAGAIGAAITTGGLVAVGNNPCLGGCASGGSNSLLAGYAIVAGGLALVWLGTWAAHRLLGGKSKLGWPLLGAGAGALIGTFATLFADVATSRGGVLRAPLWVYSVVGSALAAVGGGLMSEIGDFLVVRQEQSVANTGRF